MTDISKKRTIRSNSSEISKANLEAIVSCLASDYEGIIYVEQDKSEIILENRNIPALMPEWENGMSLKCLIGIIEDKFCHPEDREHFHRHVQQDFVTKTLQENSEHSVRYRVVLDGQVHHYKMRFTSVKLEGHESEGYIVCWTNTDDIVAQEQERLKALEEAHLAQESSRMKSLMVQNISHDIRTPLNSIVGFSQILSMPNMYLSDEDRAQFAEYITSSAEMLTVLIDDVLNLSDIEHNLLKINRTNSSCNESVRKSVNCCRTRVAQGVNLYYTSELEPSYAIYTDPKRVQQILINLLSNACKHTDKGQIHVHCSASENPGYITFSVTDTGCGIPLDKSEEIFERFKSLDLDKGGHGMGLNICRTLSEMLDGKVMLDTTYRNGARFVLMLPDIRKD